VHIGYFLFERQKTRTFLRLYLELHLSFQGIETVFSNTRLCRKKNFLSIYWCFGYVFFRRGGMSKKLEREKKNVKKRQFKKQLGEKCLKQHL
jgi:hypothetical protein